jgi:hypothetical protein
MIDINPQYESIFDVHNIDTDCDKIAALMKVEANLITEVLEAGLDTKAVTMYLQLLKSMCNHFVKDEHFCYFDDLYSPEYVMQSLYEKFQMYGMSHEASALLNQGHDEILESECYQAYGSPSYL